MSQGEDQIDVKKDLPSQEDLAGAVKTLHAQLRAEYKRGAKGEDEIWKEHLLKEDQLHRYARSMRTLATDLWRPRNKGAVNVDSSSEFSTKDRIDWCVGACLEYFNTGTLVKLISKDLRRISYGTKTVLEKDLLSGLKQEELVDFVSSSFPRPWSLLDVGSCYNPFSAHEELFEVTAIDIAPACEFVLKCDFLNIAIGPKCKLREGGKKLQFARETFDVVVFSLLLSYFPSSKQRLKCCLNAFELLRVHGILLIVTPDSSHQNKNMAMVKSWQQALECVGLSRWKYAKLCHLHCMAFRKCSRDGVQSASSLEKLSDCMFIPQDVQEPKDKDWVKKSGKVSSSSSSFSSKKDEEPEGKNNDVTYEVADLPCEF